MPRRARCAAGGIVYHVFNRAVGRMTMFQNDSDYVAYEQIMREALRRHRMRLLSYCLMPNHWHKVLWPYEDGDLSRFMFWLTMTHAQRWHHAHSLVGLGPLYQGRFHAVPVEEDHSFLILCRYTERNALRAGLVDQAENWPYSSLFVRLHSHDTRNSMLTEWPVERPDNWIELVNAPQTEAEVDAVRTSLYRNRPLGSPAWQREMARQMGLYSCFRPRGRPRKKPREGPNLEHDLAHTSETAVPAFLG